jgi:hypothetical protein
MKKFTESIDLELTLDNIIDLFLSIEDLGHVIAICDHSGDQCYQTRGFVNHKNFELDMISGKKMFFVRFYINSDKTIEVLKDIFIELDNITHRLEKQYGFFIKELDIDNETFVFPYKLRYIEIKFTNMK